MATKQLYHGWAKNSRGRWPILHLTDSEDTNGGTLCGRSFGPHGITPCVVSLSRMIPAPRGKHCKECIEFARTGSRKAAAK